MPTVFRWGPYRAFFYSADGAEPAHVHVRSGDMEAKIWLHDLTLAVNLGFRPHEIGAIIRQLRMRQAELMDAWNEHFGN